MTDNIIIFPKPKRVREESDIVNKEQIKKQYDILIKQQEEIIKQRNEIWQT
jgi:hypothetical protein|tara:strand:+ start:84 stop:236 length:153 start_codon:yes stop_codon:yes gene_type:complete